MLFSVFTQVIVWATAEKSSICTTTICIFTALVVVRVTVSVAAELLVTILCLEVTGIVAALPEAVIALAVVITCGDVTVPVNVGEARGAFASRAVCNPDVFAIERAESAIAVALPVLVTGQVRLALVVTVAALPVIEPAIAFVTSKSVNQPLVTLVAVAPIVVTKRLAHFFNVVPRSSVLSVSETRVVFIATLARLSKAVVAPEPPEAAIVTVPALPLPPVVRVIFVHSMSWTLPPLAERVTV